MCTVIVLHRPGHPWPLLLAANRDERIDRPWDAPAAHWPNRPGVVAGRDRSGGGTWMGINEAGVIAAVLNRSGSLGPAPGKRSRGELPLLALEHSTASEAAAAIEALDGRDWRSFNMVLADRNGAWFVRAPGDGRPEAVRLTPGLHMVTAHDPDDLGSPRVVRHLPRFAAAGPPAPPNWSEWQALLSDTSGGTAALNVPETGGFGTVCASLAGLPEAGPPVWLFAAGPPDRTPFEHV